MERVGGQLFHAMLNLMQSLRNFDISGPLSKSTMLMLLMIDQTAENNLEKGVMGATISSLSENLEISKPAVTKAVNYLEKHSFVTRATGQSDRRQVYVMLTEEGKRVLEQARQSVMRNMDLLVQMLGDEDIAMFIRLSEHMARACQSLKSH